MSKKANKTEDIIDSLSDDRVLNALTQKIQEKVSQTIIESLQATLSSSLANLIDEKLDKWKSNSDSNFDNMKSQICESLNDSIIKLIENKVESMSTTFQSTINSLDKRVNHLENLTLRNDIIISGFRPKKELPLMESVIELLKDDLGLQMTSKNFNYLYIMKNKGNLQPSPTNYPPPIVVGFSSEHTRNDLLAKVRYIRKQKLKSDPISARIYYNERLSKPVQEIFYQSRLLVKEKKINSAWTYKGEVYIKKVNSSSPSRILTINDLKEYR